MAISYDNAITKNYHGMMGGIVFRCRGDKSIMSKRPDCSKVVKTKAQKDNMKRFAAATIYGKKVLSDPRLREKYEKKKKMYQSVWNAAISDFMSKPKVDAIDVKDYKGLPGNEIRISALERFKFVAVIVTILNILGQVLESGRAVARPLSDGMEWDYVVKEINPSYKGSRVVVRVVDFVGNVVQESISIDGFSPPTSMTPPPAPPPRGRGDRDA
jgi:hypothetical protein